MDYYLSPNNLGYFMVFTKDAGNDSIEVRVQDGDVWLTQKSHIYAI